MVNDMDWKTLLLSFSIVFLAELGDKTQLTALTLTTSRGGGTWAVFLGAGAALVCATAMAVFCGSLLTRWLPERYLQLGSAVLFIIIGVCLLTNMAWQNGRQEDTLAPSKSTVSAWAREQGGKQSLLKTWIIKQVTAYEQQLVNDIDNCLQKMAPSKDRELLTQIAAIHRRHGQEVAHIYEQEATEEEHSLEKAEQIPEMVEKLQACNGHDQDRPIENIIRRQEAAAEFYIALAQVVNRHQMRDLLRRLAAQELRLAEQLCTAFHHDDDENHPGNATKSVSASLPPQSEDS